jgi:hypothetical protein
VKIVEDELFTRFPAPPPNKSGDSAGRAVTLPVSSNQQPTLWPASRGIPFFVVQDFRQAEPEPESTIEEFELWLDQQEFDNVERLFDGGHWNPKVGAKHSRVREWLKSNLQAQRHRDWLQENRQAQRSREARSARIAAIDTKLIQITTTVNVVIATAWIVWGAMILSTALAAFAAWLTG